MKVYFQKSRTADVVKELKKTMLKTESKQWIDIHLEQNNITITISKLGTSKLFFLSNDFAVQGCCWHLIDMEVAFTHRVYRKKFKEEAIRFFKQIGGSVELLSS